MSKFTDIRDAFIDFLNDIFHDFFDALTQSIRQGGGKVLIDAAMKAVKAAEETGGSGADKFNAARGAVIAELKEKGVPLVENAIQGAILAAVANIKQK